MAVVVREKENTREGDSENRQWTYMVFGAATDQDAINAASTVAPSSYQGLILTRLQVTTIREDPASVASNVHEVEPIYSKPPDSEDSGPSGSSSYSFSFQATSILARLSLETVKRYGTDDAGVRIPGNEDKDTLEANRKITDYHNAMGVEGTGAQKRHTGINLPVPSTTNTWSFTTAAGFVGDRYQRNVEKIMGSTNKNKWKNREAGSMRFVSCNGSVTSTADVWRIEFGFAFEPNVKDIVVGPIDKIEKLGHEVIWVEYISKYDDKSKIQTIFPKGVYIERVFREADFNLLGF